MATLLVGGLLLARVVAGGPSTGLPPNPEAPGATNLLRASRMADEARSRLAPPKPKATSRWRRGGGGWATAEPLGAGTRSR